MTTVEHKANPSPKPANGAGKARKTACILDCPDACGLEVIADGERLELRASDANSFTQGFICKKVRRLADHIFGAERLRYPMIRVGPKTGPGQAQFKRVSWQEAYSRITEQMERLLEAGRPESILPLSYGGSNGLLTQDTLDRHLFHSLGASRLARTVCAAPSSAAHSGLYGRMAGVALEDYVNSDLIVVWGCNPSVTGIHFVPIVKAARERGAKLVVVDPRTTPLARTADLHLAPRPGTDLPLALNIAHQLFDKGWADQDFLAEHCRGVETFRERAAQFDLAGAADTTGIEQADLERFAELYASSKVAAIRCGWGVERNRNGGSAVAAVLALPAVGGKFGVRGGGFTMSNSGAWNLDDATTPTLSTAPLINMNHVGRVLTGVDTDAPPIELLFIYNHNALATLPNQEQVRKGLLREDLFTVVFDQVMTDTAQLADVLLPATTFLEHRDLAKSYGVLAMQPVEPVIEPVGEARDNHQVFGDLCRLMQIELPKDSSHAAMARNQLRKETKISPGMQGGDIVHPEHGPNPVQFVDVFPGTPDQRIHLVPKALEEMAGQLYAYRPQPGAERYQLTLISPATSKRTSSTFGQLHRDIAELEMHPSDAAPRGLSSATGQVKIHNQLGEVHCGLRITDSVRAGTVVLYKGLWSHNTLNGATANALAPDHLADLGGGACFNDCRVEVEAL